MPVHTCKKCGKEFTDKSFYNRHLARKTPCAPVIDSDDLPEEKKDSPNKCRFCGRVFSTQANMSRHMKKSCKIAPREGNEDGMEKLYEHVLRKQEAKMKRMEELLEKQQAEIETLKTHALVPASASPSAAIVPAATHQTVAVGSVTNNVAIDNSIGKTINRTNITINVFERENLDRITRQQVWNLLRGLGPVGDNVKTVAEKAIIQAAMLIYSDPEHPEDITCYLPNKKGDEALVHGEGGWEIQPVSLVVSPMAAQGIELLFKNQPGMGDKFEERPKDDVDWVMTTCGDIMRYLAKNEGTLCNEPPRGEFRSILIRNKDLLQKVLSKLPIAGVK